MKAANLRLVDEVAYDPSSAKDGVKRIGHQNWTEDSLLIESEHNDIVYYTTRWDALCPYIEVTEDMLKSAPKPFYCLCAATQRALWCAD